MNVILTLVLGTCTVLCLQSGADAQFNHAYENQDYRNQGSFVNDGQLFYGQGLGIRNQGQYRPNQDHFWPGQDLWRGQGNNFASRPDIISSGQRYKRSLYRSTRRNDRRGNLRNNGRQWLNQGQTTSELWGNEGRRWRNRDRVTGNHGQQWSARGQQWRNRDSGLLRRNGKNQLFRGRGQILDNPTDISGQPRRYKRSLYRSTRRNDRRGNLRNNGGQWFNQRETTSDLLAFRNRGQRFENQGHGFENRRRPWRNQGQARRFRNQGQFTGINDHLPLNQGHIGRNQGQQSIIPPSNKKSYRPRY